MWSLRKLTDGDLATFLSSQIHTPFTYPNVGATAHDVDWPEDFDHVRNRVFLGSGAEVFERARRALASWRHFPSAWAEIFPAHAPIVAGNTVAVLLRAMDIWWWNSARIVYVIDDSGTASRYGYAYGTLPGHAERGEEQFLVEWDAQGKVWYSIRSFSRPRMLGARLAYPVVRRLQQRFLEDSCATMMATVGRV